VQKKDNLSAMDDYILTMLNRWLHGSCDGIYTEDDAEMASDFGYHCLLCRPITGVEGELEFRPPQM
jgi:hypothetical protein